MMIANEGISEKYLSIWLKLLVRLVKLQVVILLMGFALVFQVYNFRSLIFVKNGTWRISLTL